MYTSINLNNCNVDYAILDASDDVTSGNEPSSYINCILVNEQPFSVVDI